MIPPGTETLAFALRLRPGTEAEYHRRHTEIWPEMAQTLADAGIIHYEIHLSPTENLLFAFILRHQNHTMANLPANPIFQRWQSHMADLLVPTNGQLRIPLEPMFTLPDSAQP
jgi:L-rhamnose mutarotase